MKKYIWKFLFFLCISIFIFNIKEKDYTIKASEKSYSLEIKQQLVASSVPVTKPSVSSTTGSSISPTTTPVVSTVPKGLVKIGKHYQYFENGKPVKNKWRKINGYKYYFKANNNAAVKSCRIDGKYYIFNAKGRLCNPRKNAIVTVKDMKFYVTPSGEAIPGWKIIRKKLYYVYKNGRCAANETIDKIRFTKDSYAKSNSISNLKIKAMQVAKTIIEPDMNKEQKLRACWYYINTFRFKAKSYPDETKKNWKYQCALDMLNAKCGNCYGIAHAFAALAKEAGYKPYVIVIHKVHCWVRIDGKYWDNMGNRMGVSKSNKPYKKDQISKF